MKKYDWIIGICNTASDGILFFKFRGSKEEVKKQILSLVEQDREKDTETWEYGCESMEDINEEENGYKIYGYGNYVEYHIDYVAEILRHIQTIPKYSSKKQGMRKAMKLKTEFGTEKIQLEVCGDYFTGGLSIGMNHKEDGEWMPYGDLTTVLPTRVPNYCAFVDTNNYPRAIEFIEQYKLGEKTEIEAKSGYCTYPLYRFNADKLRKLCPDGMEDYESCIGVIK